MLIALTILFAWTFVSQWKCLLILKEIILTKMLELFITNNQFRLPGYNNLSIILYGFGRIFYTKEIYEMSTWLQKAIECAPEFKKDFESSCLTSYTVFMELLPVTRQAYIIKDHDRLKKFMIMQSGVIDRKTRSYGMQLVFHSMSI
jgi:hypothetical protein